MPVVGIGLRQCNDKSGWIWRKCFTKADMRRSLRKGPAAKPFHRRAPFAPSPRVRGEGRVRGSAYQPRDHWIARDVACRGQQVQFVDHHRAEATLEKMAGPAEPLR
jgi:hypothetical protein